MSSIEEHCERLGGLFENQRLRRLKIREELTAWIAAENPTSKCDKHQEEMTPHLEQSIIETDVESVRSIVWIECKQCRAARIAMEEGGRLHSRGVPKNMIHCSFKNFVPQNDLDQTSLAAAQDFACSQIGFLCMSGEFGNGKTHLAVSVLRQVGDGMMITNDKLMQRVSKRYDDHRERDVIEDCQSATLLIIDDVGMSRGGSDELPALHRILDHRYGEIMPTILTSNLPLDEFRNFIGPRMSDRLSEASFRVLKFTGPSKRPSRRVDYLK